MKPSQTNASPFPDGQSRPTPRTFEDLKRLNPRTAAVILGGALARRKTKDAQLRSQIATDVVAGAANEGAVALAKDAL